MTDEKTDRGAVISDLTASMQALQTLAQRAQGAQQGGMMEELIEILEDLLREADSLRNAAHRQIWERLGKERERPGKPTSESPDR